MLTSRGENRRLKYPNKQTGASFRVVVLQFNHVVHVRYKTDTFTFVPHKTRTLKPWILRSDTKNTLSPSPTPFYTRRQTLRKSTCEFAKIRLI